jgi:hypothetical protein
LLFHDPIIGEIHLLELVDKMDQSIQSFLVHARLAGLDAR